MRVRVGDLTPKPPMGWNSWDCLGRCASEKAMMDNLEVMSKRLAPYGYEYFVLDMGWYVEYRIEDGRTYPIDDHHAVDVRIDENGRYLPCFLYFPNGLQPLIDRTHELGLKFGIHLMRGIPRKAAELNLPIKGTDRRAADIANREDTCVWCDYNYGVDMDKPGAQEYYDSVIELLASWGVDFVKFDDATGFPKEVEAVAKAIAKCGRAVVLSLSPGGDTKPEYLDVYKKANMLRVTTDIWDNREDLDRAFEAWAKYQPMHDPADGFWFDLDMIPFGHLQLCRPRLGDGNDLDYGYHMSGRGSERMCRLTEDQMRTFITMRAMAASPLFMGGHLPTTDEKSLDLITNRDIIECNQNGVMGRRVYLSDGIEVWLTPRRRSETAVSALTCGSKAGRPLSRCGEEAGSAALKCESRTSGWIGVFNRNQEARWVSWRRGSWVCATTLVTASMTCGATLKYRMKCWIKRSAQTGWCSLGLGSSRYEL